jgi:hypothetical protein
MMHLHLLFLGMQSVDAAIIFKGAIAGGGTAIA